MTPAASASTVELSSRTGRAVVLAAVLGSGLAMLDGSVVNVALRTIGTDLDASLAELQWINNAYLLTLASFILLGGSLGDRFGRRRIFVVGTIWFALASLLCGIAPNPEVMVGRAAAPGRGRGAAHAGQPGDDPGRVRAGRPRQGDRHVVGTGVGVLRRRARSSAARSSTTRRGAGSS